MTEQNGGHNGDVADVVSFEHVKDETTQRETKQERKARKAAQAKQMGFPEKGVPIEGKTLAQTEFINAMRGNDITLCEGPAGTGKTFLACAVAFEELLQGKVEKIVICRVAIESGEKLGFMPGGIAEKLGPYMEPMLYSLRKIMGTTGAEDVEKMLDKLMDRKTIEIVPFAHMRGRTFDQSFVICDEAQNCEEAQLEMLFCRLGEGSKIVAIGDPTQLDIPEKRSGFKTLFDKLSSATDQGWAVCKLTTADIVRHPTVRRLLNHLSQFRKTNPPGPT